MRIVLAGISCVGKTTVGKILAHKLAIPFFDLDSEIEIKFNESISKIKRKFISEYSYREATQIVLESILKDNENFVLALPPNGLKKPYLKIIKSGKVSIFALNDSADNILERLIFFDEDSKKMAFEKNRKEKNLYLREIKKDIRFYKKINVKADHQVDICGLNSDQAANKLFNEYLTNPEF